MRIAAGLFALFAFDIAWYGLRAWRAAKRQDQDPLAADEPADRDSSRSRR